MTRAGVGFIGLGAMGEPMAAHLSRAGLLRAVTSRRHSRAVPIAAKLGVEARPDINELAIDCEVLISCVTADADIEQLVSALRSRPGAASLWIDCSTIGPQTAINASNALREIDCAFVDAPVSGGVEGARDGRLAVMCGGDAEAVARAHAPLSTFAARIVHMGPVGSGQQTKAINQVMVAGIAEAVCEALALARAVGLDRDRLIGTLSAGAAQNWFLEKRGATLWDGSFAVGFKQRLLLKDLGIVLPMFKGAGVDGSLTRKAADDFAELVAAGYGDEDISGLVRLKAKG